MLATFSSWVICAFIEMPSAGGSTAFLLPSSFPDKRTGECAQHRHTARLAWEAQREFQRAATHEEIERTRAERCPPRPLSLCNWEESGRHFVDFLPKIIPAKELMRGADGAVSFPVKRIKEDSLCNYF